MKPDKSTARSSGNKTFDAPNVRVATLSLSDAEKPSLPAREPPQSILVAIPKTIGSGEIHAAIERLATAISARHVGKKTLVLLGIANGGVELARRLAARIAQLAPTLSPRAGTLDISFHRDDFGHHPIPKEFSPTHIPADVQGAAVILVDDVLFSGRTVKAGLDELFDHGRPAKVELAILVDRGGRLLPFAPDYCGLAVTAGAGEKVIVTLDATNPERDIVRVGPIAAAKSKIENPKTKIA
jgi:pyrimidine operon attenuation protein/uracil phosphoribosyltransferase